MSDNDINLCSKNIAKVCKKDYGGFFSGKKPITEKEGMKICKAELKNAGLWGSDPSDPEFGDNNNGCDLLNESFPDKYRDARISAYGNMKKGGKRRRKITRKRKSNKKRKWSAKYKRSINCRRPKGFSQKQYCKYGRKTRRR